MKFNTPHIVDRKLLTARVSLRFGKFLSLSSNDGLRRFRSSTGVDCSFGSNGLLRWKLLTFSDDFIELCSWLFELSVWMRDNSVSFNGFVGHGLWDGIFVFAIDSVSPDISVEFRWFSSIRFDSIGISGAMASILNLSATLFGIETTVQQKKNNEPQR